MTDSNTYARSEENSNKAKLLTSEVNISATMHSDVNLSSTRSKAVYKRQGVEF